MAKKNTSDDEPENETETEVDDDEVEKIELDLGSFNRAERRELQMAFQNNFGDLRAYVWQQCFRVNAAGRVEKLFDDVGNLVLADDVLAKMLEIARRRTDPNATGEIDVSGYTQLLQTASLPKARTSKTSEKT